MLQEEETETKKCTQCSVVRNLALFEGRGGCITKTCEPCRARGRRSRTKHKKRRRENAKQWREANRDRVKQYNAHYRNTMLKPNDQNPKTWDDVKSEKGMVDKHVGKPSPHRKLHVTKDGVEGKTCSKCKEWKPLTAYGNNNTTLSWDGLRTTCKACLQDYNMKNKEAKTAYNKKYWEETKEQQTEKNKQWKAANRERVNAYARTYGQQRRDNDPNFKLRGNLRGRLRYALVHQHVEKRYKTMQLIGCSIQFLQGHLEAKFTDGMTWENYGTWHVDHIRPCVSFDLTIVKEQFQCFHYTNLQPLWAIDNIKKKATWVPAPDYKPYEPPSPLPQPLLAKV